jgi:hypothetical protein
MEKLSDQEIGMQKMLARIKRAQALGIDPDKLNFSRQKSSLFEVIRTKEQAEDLMKQLKALENK